MTTNMNDLTNATVLDRHGRECTVLQDTGNVNVRIRINGTNYGGWVPRASLTVKEA